MQNNSITSQTDIANVTVVTEENQIIVPQPITSVIEVNNPGPQGPVGPQGVAGPSEPFINIGGDVYATTSSLQVSGSFLVSGSSTFTNIGPAIFSGSVDVTSGVTMSSAVVSGSLTVNGNISFGATTDVASSKLTIESTTQGFLPPRMTTTQKNAIVTPPAGLLVYDTTLDKLNYYNGSSWTDGIEFTPENTANKQNSLVIDGTGAKYPTIDAVNSRSQIDYKKRVLSWFSDFQSFTDLWFTTSAATFTIRPASEIPFRTNQQGVGLLQSGASASTALFLTTANSNFKTLYLGQGKWNYETSILIPVLSIPASRYRIVCGFGDNNGSAFNEADGVFFIYDEGGTTNGNSPSLNWRCITSAGGVRTNSITIPVVENTWIKLRFEVNDDATEVKFFINDNLVATHTTNIPKIQNSQTLMLKQGMAKSAPGTINTTMWIDYIGFENFLTTTR